MMLMALTVAAALLLATGLILWLGSFRRRRVRQAGRARRNSRYAERGARWRSYLLLNPQRRMPRLTDQREFAD